MASAYVHERQTEYWTSRQIEEFFLDAGFEIIAFPLSQYHEKLIPADFLWHDKRDGKVFGFQYKALYRNGRDFWPINLSQRTTLQRFPWIYYCLSELRETRDHRASLHLARIVSPGRVPETNQLYPEDLDFYSRWGAFYAGLEACRNGVKVSSHEELTRILFPDLEVRVLEDLVQGIADVFALDLVSRHAVHLSPFLRGLDRESPIRVPTRTSLALEVERAREQGRTPVFSQRNLGGEDLHGIDLAGAYLERAILRESNLQAANLQRASLRQADLSGSNLQEADLSEADLHEANLTDADLRGADLRGARYTTETRWPADFDPRGAGAVSEGSSWTIML